MLEDTIKIVVELLELGKYHDMYIYIQVTTGK